VSSQDGAVVQCYGVFHSVSRDPQSGDRSIRNDGVDRQHCGGRAALSANEEARMAVRSDRHADIHDDGCHLHFSLLDGGEDSLGKLTASVGGHSCPDCSHIDHHHGVQLTSCGHMASEVGEEGDEGDSGHAVQARGGSKPQL
jgi:hypothetical protein